MSLRNFKQVALSEVVKDWCFRCLRVFCILRCMCMGAGDGAGNGFLWIQQGLGKEFGLEVYYQKE